MKKSSITGGAILLAMLAMLWFLFGGGMNELPQPEENVTEQGLVRLQIKDFEGGKIRYSFYSVDDDGIQERLGSQRAELDGTTKLRLELNSDVQNILIERTKNSKVSRKVIDASKSAHLIQFIL